MKTINIHNDLKNEIVTNFIEVYDTDYIYIPISDEKYIKKTGNVLKGELVYDDHNNKYYSSISGNILKIINVKSNKYLVIKNNYKEESINSGRARNLDKLTKDKLISNCLDLNIKNMFLSDIKLLYINCIDDDPYVFNKYMYIKNNMKELDEFCECIANLFNIEKVLFVIKNSNNDLLDMYKLNELENSKVNFKLLPDIYPIGNKLLLHDYLIKNNDEKMIELDDLINMVFSIKKNKINTEKYITINGNNIKNPCVINTKKYAFLNNIIKDLKIIDKKYDIFLNSFISGKKLNNNEVIITDDIDAIIINKKCSDDELECINCGLCVEVCPVKINPLVKNDKCIKCGLCNYICPSKIKIYERNQLNEK